MSKKVKARIKTFDEAPDEALKELQRATDFRRIFGYEREKTAWIELSERGRLPQVLLLEGRGGLGKRRLVHYLAGLDLCATGEACGACHPCSWSLAQRHEDVLWLSGDERIQLAEAELAAEHLELNPQSSRRRIVIITDLERLTVAAANRLLKFFEEPPEDSRILLTSSMPRRLLPTILSRTVQWRILPLERQLALTFLRQELSEASPKIFSDEELQAALKRSGQASGAALRLLLERGTKVSPSLAELNLLDPKRVYDVLEGAYASAKAQGIPLARLVEEWEIEMNDDYRSGHSKLAASYLVERRKTLGRLKQIVRGAQINLNAQLAMEALGFASLQSVSSAQSEAK